MSTQPGAARVVVIGAGIVGNSLVYHLARLGWKHIVQIEKGPLPNPGGSTGHASNFIFLTDHSREMTALTADSVEQYKEMGVFTQSGGIEVARTPERMEELKRRMASSRSWGIESELLTPAQVKALVPYINADVILGGFSTPGIGVVDSLRAGTIMRERAQALGALTLAPMTEVTGIDVEDGKVSRVRTDKGDFEADIVVIAAGVWSPRLAEMAGAAIPLTPAVHQMISVGPVPMLADTVGEITYPIVRDMDTNCYERQHGSDMEVGSYAHRAILMDADEIPSIAESKLSPTELPFTQEDFELQMEQALELIPDILGDERVGIRHAINGLLSLTPDGMPILGETPEVKGLWAAAAVWIKEAPGIARMVAEWMTDGQPEIDPHGSDIARFHAHQKARTHVKARSAEGFNKTYGIVHPSEQWESNRNVRLSPFNARERELGAVFFETAGWERPMWYASNEGLLEEYGERVMPRQAEWESRWWSPIINAEHLAMRDRVGMVDLSAFAIFDITGPGALDHVQRMAVAQMDVPVGRVVYTPLLNEAAGIKSDLTIMRLGRDAFRVVTGGAHGMGDRKWFSDHLPADGSAQLYDATSTWCTAGIWGPRARDVVASATSDDVSNEGFPFGTCRTIELGGIPVLASRISYVGELGWELYVPMEQGARLWDTLWEAGRPHGIVPFGIGVYGTTGRLEKGYRAHGTELELEFDLVEADMLRPKVKEAEFIGRAAYLEQRSKPPVATLCTLTVDDNTSASGVKRYMLGREPILTPDGGPITDAKGRRSFVTSAGLGSVGREAPVALVPAARATRWPARSSSSSTSASAIRSRSRSSARRRCSTRTTRGFGPDMNVLVCVKRVPATAGKITLTADERAIDTRYLGFTVSPHEECAVEEAVRIVEAQGGSSTVLTLGPEEAADQLREAMAVGIERAIHLVTDGGEWSPTATADAIVEAIRTREAADGPFDLILLGNEAADSGDYQVGVRVAVALDRPCVSGVKGLEIRDETVVARREAAGGGWEVYEVPRPAVVTVKEGINLPRYPSVPGRLRARKKEIERIELPAGGGAPSMIRLRVPIEQESAVEILGEGPEAAPRVVDVLRRLGLIA